MQQFVDLNRSFRPLTERGIDDPDVLQAHSESGLGRTLGWAELLESERVVILAEAGSGKTREMQEQTRRLVREGKSAFFFPLEGLATTPLREVFSSHEDEERFDHWLSDPDAVAWFFLDSVDELKLTAGKLETALIRLSKAINGRLDRSRIFLSSRPNDWLADSDLRVFNTHLPIPDPPHTQPPVADDLFLSVLKRDTASKETRESQDPQEKQLVQIVSIQPLNEDQVRSFAKGLGVSNPTELLNEIENKDAWLFTRRPADLKDIVHIWLRERKLGTRVEQHEANLASKLSDVPDRRDQGVLSDAKARDGAQKLAIALALTRHRTIQSPDQPLDLHRSEGSLNPAEILVDWTPQERQALLRRGLFDPATYGRVRFHHRSVQEYLAACRLRELQQKGMSKKALLRILFAERYGTKVVIPSMRAIATWLSLWEPSVRQMVMDREPEALLTGGDPESLSIADRVTLLRRFAALYGSGGWRGISLPNQEIRRLAHPDLADVVRELWSASPENEEVQDLLLSIVLEGRIQSCLDIAESAALDTTLNGLPRILGTRAVVTMGDVNAARRIATSLLRDPRSWPQNAIFIAASDLFPLALSIKELMFLVRTVQEPKKTVGGFSWALREIVTRSDPESREATALRDAMAWQIFRGRVKSKDFFEPYRSRFQHLNRALALLCIKQLSGSHPTDIALVRCAVVAYHFSDRDYVDDERKALQEQLAQRHDLRASVFEGEFLLSERMGPLSDDWDRYLRATHGSLLGRLTADDQDWLLDLVSTSRLPGLRRMALRALLMLWQESGRRKREIPKIRQSAHGDTQLLALIEENAKPPEKNEMRARWQLEHRRRKAAARHKERRRIQGWTNWKRKVAADVEDAFSAKNTWNTIANVYRWLRLAKPGSSKFSLWDEPLIREAFGEMFAKRLAHALSDVWRSHDPTLWSARKPEDRNTTLNVWIYGLCGLAAESSGPNWARTLTPQEAALASAYATVEINGLADYLGMLAVEHPHSVESRLGDELDRQIALIGTVPHLPLLQDVSHAEPAVQRLLAPRLLSALIALPTKRSREVTGSAYGLHLAQILRVLSATCTGDEARRAYRTCATRYTRSPRGELAIVWLKGMFLLDASQATKAFVSTLATITNTKDASQAIKAFADLFGDRSESVMPKASDPAIQAKMLGDLVRGAYQVVRRQDDLEHEGVFSPGTRDHAQHARNALLTALLETPGSEAQRVILELATEADFAHFPDRLRHMARTRAAQDAEAPPFSPKDVVAMGLRHELPPNDRDSLFQTMMDRLEDLQHELTHGDFTDRRLVRKATDEADMQATLATRLSARANGAYTLTREDEVADRKRTDIRFFSVVSRHKAVAEVKLADSRWTVTELERALRDQLVGQYLRHADCRAGCLLLTYDGTRASWPDPNGGSPLSFGGLVTHLSGMATRLEAEREHWLRLAVFGLDLTDPDMVPAHGSRSLRGTRRAQATAQGQPSRRSPSRTRPPKPR